MSLTHVQLVELSDGVSYLYGCRRIMLLDIGENLVNFVETRLGKINFHARRKRPKTFCTASSVAKRP
jgi:hypothetical protein